MDMFYFSAPLATRMFGVRVPTNPSYTLFGASPCYVPNERPGVNPWRHAYTRRKHFERAAEMRECLALDSYLGFDCGSPEDLHDVAHLFREAADNADWGTR